MRTLLSLFLTTALTAQLPVVPSPQGVEPGPGRIAVGSYASDHAPFARPLAAFTATLARLGAPTGVAAERVTMRFQPFPDDGKAHAAESYRIRIGNGEANVFAADPLGFARATATLCQMLEIEDGVATWPCVTIDDAPKLPFRCFMVDMGRNPHSPKVLQQVVDLCWFYKVRFLQMHLTDDQLSSWPSRAFPKLRDERAGWTWDDYVALEAYAIARGVTLVPEIDVPGHSTILRDRYPEVFGKSPQELATLPAATEGVKQLVDELLAVFQSTPYVHLGGDESGVGGDPLRDFLNRIARHVKARGRRAIVWEGVVQSPLRDRSVRQVTAAGDGRVRMTNSSPDPFRGAQTTPLPTPAPSWRVHCRADSLHVSARISCRPSATIVATMR